MSAFLRSRQLIYLALSSLSMLFIGNGLFPLLPYFAGQFGASQADVGLILATMNLSSVFGASLAGWSGRRLKRKTLFVVVGALGLPVLYLLNHVSTVWHVTVLASYLWFAGGVNLALIQVYTSMHATKANRGVAFGMMQLTMPLSALLAGGAATGILPAFGYTGFFWLFVVVWLALPLLGLCLQEGAVETSRTQAGAAPGGMPVVVLVFLAGSLLSGLAINAVRLGISLSMQARALAEAEVMTASMLGALVAIPAVLASGSLSDRIGRKAVLAVSLAIVGANALWLPAAVHPWQFAVGTAIILTVMSNVQSLIAALATDELAPSVVGRSLPWIGVAWTVAGIASFAATGYLMELLGAERVYGLAAALAFTALVCTFVLPGRLPGITLRHLAPRWHGVGHDAAALKTKPV